MPAPTFNVTPPRCQGFTLVETIIVMVVVAIAAAGISIMTGNIFNSQDSNTTLQVGMKVAQECAEQVLATHRRGAVNVNCPAFGSYTTVVTTQPYTDSGIATCPTGKTCTIYVITTSLSGDAMTPLRVMLVSG